MRGLRLVWVGMLVGCGSASLPGGGGGSGAGAGGHAGGGGSGGAGQAWCSTQAAPANVAATDYGCLDFDNAALPSGGGWTLKKVGSVTSTVTTQHASSLPDSWQVAVPAETTSAAADQATLSWHDTGSQAIATVTAAADVSPVAPAGVSPAWSSWVEILCVDVGSGDACLDYTMGDSTAFQTGYTGFFLTMSYTGSAATITEHQVFGSLTAGLWTRVQIQVAMASQQIVVTMGGTANQPITGHFDPDTVANVTVGPSASGQTSGWSAYFDNVVTEVARSQ